jgi:hypothetical protein
MKVNRWSTWSTFYFLTERFVTIDKTTKTEFVWTDFNFLTEIFLRFLTQISDNRQKVV